jgi:hypothetical protein
MPVSPADFALWARATGNKYPETAEEKLAAGPQAYSYAKNIAKTGANASNLRTSGSIFYSQPESVENNAPNSLFNAPVTPDNHAPKVAGTLDSTLTSEHFQNDEEHEVSEHNQQHSLLNTLGKAALAAGTVAAGLAVARSPGGQQALQNAQTVVKENAQDIGGRVSSFLGGLGGGRTVDPDVIRNSGDVTPPTTGQRYNQQEVPVATQAVQIAKGAPTGSSLEATLPPTSESYSVKPVTESDVITSSQTFGPRSAYEGGSRALQSLEQALPSSDAVKTARVESAKQDLLSAARNRGAYQMELPGVNPTLMALRSKDAGVSPQEAGIYQTSEAGSTISPTTEQYSLLSQTPDPWTGKYTPTAQVLGEQTSRLMPSAERQLSLPGLNGGNSSLSALENEYSWNDPSRDLQPTAWSQSKEHQLELLNPSRNIGYGKTNILSPMRHAEVKRQPLGGRSLVRTGGGVQPERVSVEHPYTYVPSEQKDISEFATSGARDVTGAFLKGKIQQLPGARDIEANIATQEAQGVSPLGRFSSLTTGEEYASALGERPSSMIDPRIVTAGGQGSASESTAEGLGGVVNRLSTLRDPLATESDKRAVTFSKQLASLYDITQDPAILEAGAKGALPINVTLPGGETTPTKSFFKPFGAVGAGDKSNLTQVQALEGNLIGKQTTLSNVKAGILNQFGLGPTEKITNQMFNTLPQSQRKTLVNAHTELTNAQTRLDAAKGNQILYSIPENVLEGTKSAPVVSALTGDVVGMTAVPEEKALDLLNFYKMRANSGVGRAQVGGVGRRREELAAQGYTGGGDADYVEPVMFKDLATGEYLDASDVSLADIAHGNVRESLGGTVSPQRLMGSSDRPYKGVSADVISPVSFDPSRQAELATAYPERVSPEGLIYSKAAMTSPGGKSRPSLGTRFDVVPKTRTEARKGSPRDIALRSIQAAEAVRGSSLASEKTSRTVLDDLVKRITSPPEQAFERASMHAAVWGEGLAPSQTIPLESPGPVRTTREFQPQQLPIPGAGIAPQINTTPALEEAVATERYMGTRPGQNLRSAMQKALSKASARQTSLF